MTQPQSHRGNDRSNKPRRLLYTTAETLKAMIAERHGLTKDHIILSSGSSGVLTSLAMMAAQRGSILGSDLFWDTTSRMGTRNSTHGIKRLTKN